MTARNGFGTTNASTLIATGERMDSVRGETSEISISYVVDKTRITWAKAVISSLSNCPEDVTLTNLVGLNVSVAPGAATAKVIATWGLPEVFEEEELPDGSIEQQATSEIKFVPIPFDDNEIPNMPAVTSAIYTAAQVRAAKAQGMRVLPIGGLRYNYSQHQAFTWSETELVSSIGSTGAPTGITSATAANWFLESRSVARTGDGTAKVTENWVYSKAGW